MKASNWLLPIAAAATLVTTQASAHHQSIYFGLEGGLTDRSNGILQVTDSAPLETRNSLSDFGAIYGGFGGIDFHIDDTKWHVALEGSITHESIDAERGFYLNNNRTQESFVQLESSPVFGFSTILAYQWACSFKPYIRLGLGFSFSDDVKVRLVDDTPTTEIFSRSRDRLRYIGGLGIESSLTKKFSWRAEYRFMDFEQDMRVDGDGNPFPYHMHLNGDQHSGFLSIVYNYSA